MPSLMGDIFAKLPLSKRQSDAIYNLVNHPGYVGQYVKPGSYSAAKLYLNINKLLHFKEMKKRRLSLLAEEIGASHQLSPSRGYLIADLSHHWVVANAIAHARKVMQKEKIEKLGQGAKKPFLIQKQLRLEQPDNEPVAALACHPIILNPIARYLGCIPVLQGAFIWYSPNSEFHGRSQLYHLDADDYKEVKVFLFIDDVYENTGPLTIIPADKSAHVYSYLRHRKILKRRSTKLEDHLIFNAADGDPGVPLCGPTGTVAFVDTCRCFHYGSRPTNSSDRPRKLLHLHFTSPFSTYLPVFGRIPRKVHVPQKCSREQGNVRNLVLGLSHLSFPIRYGKAAI